MSVLGNHAVDLASRHNSTSHLPNETFSSSQVRLWLRPSLMRCSRSSNSNCLIESLSYGMQMLFTRPWPVSHFIDRQMTVATHTNCEPQVSETLLAIPTVYISSPLRRHLRNLHISTRSAELVSFPVPTTNLEFIVPPHFLSL